MGSLRKHPALQELYNDPECDCHDCHEYHDKRVHLFNLVGLKSNEVDDMTLPHHNIRCNCKNYKTASYKLLHHFRFAPTTPEESAPPSKRRKSPDRPAPAPVEPPISPLLTPRNEPRDSSLSVSSPVIQPEPVAAVSPTPAAVPSIAMEVVEPTGEHPIDCNCVTCLQSLLQEATTIAASLPDPQPETRRPLPKPPTRGTRPDPARPSLSSEESHHLPDTPLQCHLPSSPLATVRRLLATFIGPVPSSLDLEVWGTFPVTDYTPEPLRCYNCQRYGHHKEDCQGPATCGVCSQRHDTEICIQAHKNGKETHPKCRNCSRPHHTWNKRCPERLRRIAAMKGTSTPKTNTPPLMSQPKDQRTPRQRRQRQPTTVPAPAVAKQRKSTIIPGPATKLQAVATPPVPATSSCNSNSSTYILGSTKLSPSP
ncbi:proteoglycan 4-like [Palaemon carinicauda]|uniref:proteoglycan 4-like n=1 Tax=Palaemon carinicauda TaxID=392227 RepID=UPI0035B5E5FA